MWLAKVIPYHSAPLSQSKKGLFFMFITNFIRAAYITKFFQTFYYRTHFETRFWYLIAMPRCLLVPIDDWTFWLASDRRMWELWTVVFWETWGLKHVFFLEVNYFISFIQFYRHTPLSLRLHNSQNLLPPQFSLALSLNIWCLVAVLNFTSSWECFPDFSKISALSLDIRYSVKHVVMFFLGY